MALTRGRKIGNFLLSPFTALVLLIASLEGEYFLTQTWNFLLTQVLALLTLISITIDIRRRIPLRIIGKARIFAAFIGLLLLFLGLSYSLFWKLTSNGAVAFEGMAVMSLLYGVTVFIAVSRDRKRGMTPKKSRKSPNWVLVGGGFACLFGGLFASLLGLAIASSFTLYSLAIALLVAALADLRLSDIEKKLDEVLDKQPQPDQPK